MFSNKIQNISVRSRTTGQTKDSIPKTLFILFLIPEILFGADYGFTKVFKNFQKIVKKAKFAMSVLTMIILFAPVSDRYGDLWFCFNIAEYIMYLLVLYTTKYKVYDFILEISKIYDQTATEKTVIRTLTSDYTILTFAMKLFIFITDCETPKEYCPMYKFPIYLFYMVPGFCEQLFALTQVIIVYNFYCCIRKLKKALKKSNVCYTDAESHYMAIVHCYDNIRPLNAKFKFIQLIIFIPKLLGTLWSTLYLIKYNENWTGYTAYCVFFFDLIIQLFVPAVITEMFYSQVDAIKQFLKEKLLTEKDDRKSTEVTHLLRCLEVHRLDHLVLRFIPLDVRLLLSLFSLCTSYFIVILQFTHLYD